jgi:hypothetical protein
MIDIDRSNIYLYLSVHTSEISRLPSDGTAILLCNILLSSQNNRFRSLIFHHGNLKKWG